MSDGQRDSGQSQRISSPEFCYLNPTAWLQSGVSILDRLLQDVVEEPFAGAGRWQKQV